MNRRLSIFSFIVLALAACAPSDDKDHPTPPTFDFAESTGFHASNGAPYTNGGDPRVAPVVHVLVDNAQKPGPKRVIVFSQTLEDFKFQRFDDADKNQRRFGKDHFHFEVQRRDDGGHRVVIKCDGRLAASGTTLKFSQVQCDTPLYKLEGAITDGTDTSAGHFKIHYRHYQALVFFRAYKARAHFRTDNEQDLSQTPKLLDQVNKLKQSTFWWVTNIVVPMGISRYHYDILQFVDSRQADKPTPATISFSGDSVQVGEVPAPLANLEATDDGVQSVQEKGDSYQDNRVFSLYLRDEDGKTTEVMMDLDRDAAGPEEVIPPDELPKPPSSATPAPDQETPPSAAPDETTPEKHETPIPHGAPDAGPPPIVRPSGPTPDEETTAAPSEEPETSPSVPPTAPESSPSTPVKKSAQTAKAPSQPLPKDLVGVTERAYLVTDYNNPDLPRTHRVINDWEKNFNTPVVQGFYNTLKNPKYSTMRNFYKYAYPLKDYIESIAEAYDYPPGFAYIVINESMAYLSGNYTLESGRTSTSWGPFQIVTGTARNDGNMSVRDIPKGANPGKSDERSYFVTGACGAARYLHGMTNRFLKGDTTLAIMGYNQGEGAAAAVAQVRRLGGNFSYDFATIARNHMANKKWVEYVGRFLAAYFVSGDPASHRFDLRDVQAKMPKNAVPPFTIHDPVCRDAIGKTVLAPDIQKP